MRFARKWADAGRSMDPEYVAHYSAKGKNNRKTLEAARIYLPSQLIFGINSERELLFFSHRGKRRDGEMEVIGVTCKGEIDQRFASFSEMLRRYLLVFKKQVQMYRDLRAKQEQQAQKGKRR